MLAKSNDPKRRDDNFVKEKQQVEFIVTDSYIKLTASENIKLHYHKIQIEIQKPTNKTAQLKQGHDL